MGRKKIIAARASALALAGALAATLLIGGLVASAEEWPQWRGPRDDGIVRDVQLADAWPAGGPKKLWSTNVGAGFSSPVAVDGKLYVFALQGNDQDVLFCFDLETGRQLWRQSYERLYRGRMPGGALANDWKGTRASPVIEGDRLYTYGPAGDLVCRELKGGRLLWHVNVLAETRSTPIEWGQASNPTIDGDVIYVQGGMGGPLAFAINKKTGRAIWAAQAAQGGYAKPVVGTVGGAKQVFIFGGKAFYGLDAKTGRTLWQVPYETEYDVNAATPIFRDGQLLVTSSYRQGRITLFNVTPNGAEQVWSNRDIRMKFQVPIVEDGFIYGTNGEPGDLVCMRWADGSVVWKGERISQGGSMVRVGKDRMILFTQTGKGILARVTPERYEKLSEAQLVERTGNAWSTPLVYRGKLVVKGRNDLVCYDVGAK